MYALPLSYIGMGSSEVAVRYALERLQATGEKITQAKVAEFAQCHPRTVSRVFAVWRQRGELKMEGTPRSGYTFIYTPRDDDAPTHR